MGADNYSHLLRLPEESFLHYVQDKFYPARPPQTADRERGSKGEGEKRRNGNLTPGPSPTGRGETEGKPKDHCKLIIVNIKF
jgi:hypothetical protein